MKIEDFVKFIQDDVRYENGLGPDFYIDCFNMLKQRKYVIKEPNFQISKQQTISMKIA